MNREKKYRIEGVYIKELSQTLFIYYKDESERESKIQEAIDKYNQTQEKIKEYKRLREERKASNTNIIFSHENELHDITPEKMSNSDESESIGKIKLNKPKVMGLAGGISYILLILGGIFLVTTIIFGEYEVDGSWISYEIQLISAGLFIIPGIILWIIDRSQNQ